MICEQCDAPVSEGDAFCGVCGAFLDWSGPRAAPPAQPPPPGPKASAAPEPGAAGGTGPGTSPATACPVPEPEPRPEPEPDWAAETGTGPKPAADSSTQDPGTPEPERAAEQDGDVVDPGSSRAAALLAPAPTGSPRPRERPRAGAPEGPPASPGPQGERPVAVPPGPEAVPRPRVRSAADEYAAAPDDVACPACRTPNPAGRSFCRRCGSRLSPEAAAARQPWWRRLLRRRAPRRHGPAGRLRRPLVWLALLLAAVAAGWAAIVYGPSAIDTLRDRFGDRAAVRPASVRASSAAPGHPADLAVDGAWNRFWAPAAAREPEGQWLEASFREPYRLTEIIVHSGSSDQADAYLRQARPVSLTITGWDSGGEQVGERTVTLQDRPGEQVLRLTMDGVATIRLTIESVSGQRPSRLVALGEVEFFRRP